MGPDPATCKISEACAATAAALYFLEPYKIRGTSYFDSDFPFPHDVSSLALDEARTIFGKHLEISLVLNIGPSAPNPIDIRQLAAASSSARSTRIGRALLWSRFTGRSGMDGILMRKSLAGAGGSDPAEQRLRLKLKTRLESEYLDGDRLYHCIRPLNRFAPKGLCLNDVSAIDSSDHEVDKFRADPQATELTKAAVSRYCISLKGLPHEIPNPTFPQVSHERKAWVTRGKADPTSPITLLAEPSTDDWPRRSAQNDNGPIFMPDDLSTEDIPAVSRLVTAEEASKVPQPTQIPLIEPSLSRLTRMGTENDTVESGRQFPQPETRYTKVVIGRQQITH